MTTVDVTNLRRSKEPLATLAKFRRWNSAVWFGTNLIPRGAGWLTVGDLLDVDQVRAHPSLG
jgi:uncharacterized protein YcbX